MIIKRITLDYFQKNRKRIIKRWFVIWEDTPWFGFAQTEKEAIEFFIDHIKRGIVLFAIEKQKIIGMLTCYINLFDEYGANEYDYKIYKEIKIKYKDKFASLTNIALDVDHRGKGIGKLLISKLLDELAEKQIKALFIYTEKSSLSHNFYQRFGCKKFGKINRVQRPDLKLGYEDRVYYIKELN